MSLRVIRGSMLKTHEKNEYAWGDKYEQMEYDLKIRDLKLEEKQKELDQALKEREDFKVKLEKWSNASVLQNEVLNKQRYVSDKSCIGFGDRKKRPTKQYHSNLQKLVDSDDEETDVSESQKETAFNSENSETSFENRSPNSQNSVGQETRTKGLEQRGYSTTRTPHRPQRPKKIVKSIWVKKGSTIGSQAVLPQTVKKGAMINPKQTWRLKGNYLDSVNRDNGSYTLKQFEYAIQRNLKDYLSLTVDALEYDRRQPK
ncbi:hypothetical protein Tco_0521799 [Tanacetum coccineum]